MAWAYNETILDNLESRYRNASSAYIAESDLFFEQRERVQKLKSDLVRNWEQDPNAHGRDPKGHALAIEGVQKAEKKLATITANRDRIAGAAQHTNANRKAVQEMIRDRRLLADAEANGASYARPAATSGNLRAAIEKARSIILDAKRARAELDTRFVPRADALARLHDEIARVRRDYGQLAVHGFVSRGGEPQSAVIARQIIPMPDGSMQISPAFALKPELVTTLALDAASALYEKMIEEFYAANPGADITDADRAAQITKLESDLRAAEEREEALIRFGEDELGMPVPRRADAPAEAMIGPLVEVPDKVPMSRPSNRIHMSDNNSRSAAAPAYRKGPQERSWDGDDATA